MDIDLQQNHLELDGPDEIMLPGFRFHPTDEELIAFYLRRKVQQRPIRTELIKQLDIYKFDPWDLPRMGSVGEKEWYFYCRRERKYRNGNRPNRVACTGFWKATGPDRPVYSSDGTKFIGLKKILVFYQGRASRGIKTEWMMHEFRLPADSLDMSSHNFDPLIANDSWTICRIFKKNPVRATQRAPPCMQTRSLAESTISDISLPSASFNLVYNNHRNPNPLITTTAGSFNSSNIIAGDQCCCRLDIQYPNNEQSMNGGAVYTAGIKFGTRPTMVALGRSVSMLPNDNYMDLSNNYNSSLTVPMPVAAASQTHS